MTKTEKDTFAPANMQTEADQTMTLFEKTSERSEAIADILHFHSHYCEPESLANMEALGIGINWRLMETIQEAVNSSWDISAEELEEICDEVDECVEEIQDATIRTRRLIK